MTTPATTDIAEVYDRTAPYYRALTSQDDYRAWTALVDRAITAAGAPGRRLLDVGCGAGRSAAHLADLGYAVTGIDASPHMVALARTRPDAAGVDFHVHDARTPFADGEYDIVNCMSDVVNYLLDPADLDAAFDAAARALRPGGLLVFDVNTEHGYRAATAEPHVIAGEDSVLVWRGLRTGERDYQFVLDAFDPQGSLWRRSTVVHEQRRHDPGELAGRLAAAGVPVTTVHGMLPTGRFGPADDPSATKLIIVARRTG
jgi:SAM-dependent methyltransferase